MTEYPEPNKDEQQVLLRSLIEVGSSKPVGYLPLHTIQKFLHLGSSRRSRRKAQRDSAGNLPPMPGAFPDYPATAVRTSR